MILDIDAGNSHIKWRVADQENIRQQGVITHHQKNWPTLIDHKTDIERVRISSVAGPELGASLVQWLENNIELKPEIAVAKSELAGVANGYTKPETLGVDRWLAMVAGWNLATGPCLVVDAGSALTADLVSTIGQHEGGYIVPGFYMMFDALYGGTANVRFEQNKDFGWTPGKNTGAAVQNGCLLMSIALVDKCLEQLEAKEGAGTLILTGGGAQPLVEYFKDKAVHIPDLVLDGLRLALP